MFQRIFRRARFIFYVLTTWEVLYPTDEEVGKMIDTSEEPITCAVVPFGSIHPGNPLNASNKSLAEAMEIYNKAHGLDGVGQWEFKGTQGIQEPLVGKPGDTHITTRAFFTEIRLTFPKISRIFVIAHPDHALRCKWVSQDLGFEVVAILQTGPPVYSKDDNIQYWTRSRLSFLWFEFLARVHHLIFGWI